MASVSSAGKSFVRRSSRDRSQTLRRAWQLGFLTLNVWMGGQFYLWVRGIERESAAAGASRPAGIEGYLPIAGLMNLKYWVASGELPKIHPAAMFLFVAICGSALLLRKAFCSWLCPVGTVSEGLWRAGRKLFGRNWMPPRVVDVPLRGVKYLLLAFFVWAVSLMSAGAIEQFMGTAYGLGLDVKMLDFFRRLSGAGLVILLLLASASLFVKNSWCRYGCPYGALLGILAVFSPLSVRREKERCIDCAMCAKACPAALPVDELVTIRSAECTGCLECTAACPADGTLQMTAGVGTRARFVPAWVVAVGVAMILLGTVAGVKLAGHWESAISNSQYRQLITHANEAIHPAP
ncbi:MAG: 4Fe-4S binding protein [Acidobacteriales bacterium]|nr:4Fe-4S binding protein [Terriglobales bacterium]